MYCLLLLSIPGTKLERAASFPQGISNR